MTQDEMTQAIQALEQKVTSLENRTVYMTNIPSDLETWKAQQASVMQEHVKKLNAIVTDIRTKLNELLEGKVKPHDQTLTKVMEMLERHDKILKNFQQ